MQNTKAEQIYYISPAVQEMLKEADSQKAKDTGWEARSEQRKGGHWNADDMAEILLLITEISLRVMHYLKEK